MSVEDIQNSAYSLARTAFDNSVTSVNNMTSYLNNAWWSEDLGIQPPAPVVPGQITALATGARVSAPTLPTFDGVTAPTAPVLSAFTIPNIGNIPDLLIAEPILDFPVAPDASLPAAPGASPEFNAPALPDKPVFSLPVAPTFTPVALPDSPLIEVPYFDADADFGDITAPTERFVWGEQEYTSALLDETKAKLLNDIRNGGYGLDLEDERRLWDRARERELINASAKIAEVSRMNAARGFSIPPGALLAQQEAVQQDMLEKNSSLSRDIMVKKADLFAEHRKFTITAATQLEDMLMRYFGSVAERALNAARTQVEMGVAIFNAQVGRYNAKVQAYQSYAAAYEARVRAALTGVEIYKAKIEGARLSVELQKLYADVYQTQINGVNALVNLYKSEMDAAQVAATIEQMKLTAFKTQVESYSEQVKARVAEFDMFEAQIKGEMAKVDAYKASVQAYTARVQGYESKARTAETVARTEIAQTSSRLEVYRTDMERYKAEIGIASEKIRTTLQKFDSQVREYAAYIDAAKAGADNDTRAHEATSRNYVAYSGIVAERLKAMIDHTLKDMELHASAHNEAGRTAATLGSAWASGVTGLSASIAST